KCHYLILSIRGKTVHRRFSWKNSTIFFISLDFGIKGMIVTFSVLVSDANSLYWVKDQEDGGNQYVQTSPCRFERCSADQPPQRRTYRDLSSRARGRIDFGRVRALPL